MLQRQDPRYWSNNWWKASASLCWRSSRSCSTFPVTNSTTTIINKAQKCMSFRWPSVPKSPVFKISLDTQNIAAYFLFAFKVLLKQNCMHVACYAAAFFTSFLVCLLFGVLVFRLRPKGQELLGLIYVSPIYMLVRANIPYLAACSKN